MICDINESSAESFREELPDALKDNMIYQNCDVSCSEEFKCG